MAKARDFDEFVVGKKVVTDILADHFVKDGADFKIIDIIEVSILNAILRGGFSA